MNKIKPIATTAWVSTVLVVTLWLLLLLSLSLLLPVSIGNPFEIASSVHGFRFVTFRQRQQQQREYLRLWFQRYPQQQSHQYGPLLLLPTGQLLQLSLSRSIAGLSEFDLLQQVLYRNELDGMLRESTWLDSIKSLPFECTGCGNCCRTEGNVYMSPKEIQAASRHLNMTLSDFIQAYAYTTLLQSNGDRNCTMNNSNVNNEEHPPWILVKDVNTEEGHACCIFLNSETNQCSIYPARPIQCSTYPFWTNVLESENHWNDEVRRRESDTHSKLPPWTAVDGGCEGMDLLTHENTCHKDRTGVPIDEALEQLSLYQLADRRLPRDHRNYGDG
jgi:uncharacterized protein